MNDVTMAFAIIHGDPLVHILSNGSNGEWQLCCGNHWFTEVLRPDVAVPTCLQCIVEDARWWRSLRGAVKQATFMR